MGKVFLFSLLWWLTGSPFLAVIILLVIIYVLDRRYVGIFPSLTRPIARARKLAKLRQELRLHPHHTTNKVETSRLLIERKQYAGALEYLEQVLPVMEDSAEVLYDLGLCHLALGRLEQGEHWMTRALDINPKVRYGEPYLRLGEAYAGMDLNKALTYLEKFREVHSSSCEAYYRLGQIYLKLNRDNDAKNAFREAVDIYKGLPKYKKKSERRWALLASFRRK